jgi:uncharacterized protein (TIGR03083 family)
MAAKDIWAAVHVERHALAGDLSSLSDAQWEAASWSEQWSVRDVVAHMTASASMNPASFFAKLVANGFSFSKLQAKDIARERGASSAETLSRFQAIVDSTAHPPGPTVTWLGESLVHAEDVRRPLGITRAYPTDKAAEVASFYAGSNLLIGSKQRIAGLRLHATDADWSSGTGPSVEGPIMSLVLAMTGRTGALGELSGDGVDALRVRP